MTQKKWLTVREFAEYVSMSEDGVYNMIHRQELPYSKLGSRVRIDKHEVDLVLAQSRVQPTKRNKPNEE